MLSAQSMAPLRGLKKFSNLDNWPFFKTASPMASIKHYIKVVYNFIFELIFPRFCVGCNQEGTWLCSSCFQKIVKVSSQVCPGCGRLSPQGRYCLKCRKGKFLKGIIAAVYFEEGPTQEIIHNFKYNSVLEFGPILGEIMLEKIDEIPGKNRIITYVPLHQKRLAQRGYNQAELLTREIANIKKMEENNLIVKIKHTKRQVGLVRQKRRKNLQGVFKVREGIAIKNKNIIVIDD